jgi:AcrR family transcriptional regulator
VNVSNTDHAKIDTGAPSTRAERMEELVDAALSVFAQRGFAAARIDDIAKRAGVAKGTLYLYFRSKEDMFEAVIREKMVPVAEAVERFSQDSQASATTMLKRQLEFAYDALTRSERRHIVRLILSEGHAFPEITKFYYEQLISRGMRAMERVIELGVERGEFKRHLRGEFLVTSMAPAIVYSLWQTTFGAHHELDRESYMHSHIDMVLSALCRAD